MAVHHYMVEFEDEQGKVQFANETEITSLTSAKAQASALSRDVPHGAYVVAFSNSVPGANGGFVAIGHISFFDGKQSETDGIVL